MCLSSLERESGHISHGTLEANKTRRNTVIYLWALCDTICLNPFTRHYSGSEAALLLYIHITVFGKDTLL